MSLALPASRSLVLADYWSRSAAADVVTVLAATGLTALAAQVAIPIPGTPVPVTGQTFAVLLAAAAIGPVRGALAQGLYLVLALVGLPVLAQHKSGASVVFGAIVASIVVGVLARRGMSRRPLSVFVSYVAGSAVIYVFGVTWLALSLSLSVGSAISAGLTPFLLGDLLKALLAAGLLPLAWKGVTALRGSDAP